MRDAFGNLQATIQNFSRLEYARAENKLGFLNIDLDPNSPSFPGNVLNQNLVDFRLEPWRQVGTNPPYLDGETVFFIRKWGFKVDSNGLETFHIEAQDAICLLDSRNVAYYSDDTQSLATAVAADDLAKRIVQENLGSSATDTTRSLATWVSVAANLTLAPVVTKDFSRRQVLQVLQEVAGEAKVWSAPGVYVVFDIVYTSPTMLEFRTYVGQRGVDHGQSSGQTVVISRERKNLEDVETYVDHSKEFTYIYAGGIGTKKGRIIQTVSAFDINFSPFNRRELWVSANNTDRQDAILSQAYEALYANQAHHILTGNIVDTDGCRDGINFRWGDKVYVEHRGIGFDGHIDAFHVTIENGNEIRENKIKGEGP